MLVNKNFDPHFDVLILGAGLSGTLAALELPSHLKIALVDVGDEVIHARSTSYNQCNKLHIGLHYAGDIETAQKCLEDSLLFASKYKNYILGQPSDPWRRGRYFVMSNSLFSPDKIKDVSASLSDRYQQEAKKCNYVFGQPEDFIRVIKPEQYPDIAKEVIFTDEKGHQNNTHVELGIETSESQINIDVFRVDLKKRIDESESISFIPHHKVTKIDFDPKSLSYTVHAENIHSGLESIFYGESVVNSTWQNIELLDKRKRTQSEDERLIRVKASVLVKLPRALHRLNTCIFSVGPFCSFTNLGNGTGILTEESVSNIGHYVAGGKLSSSLEALINAENPLALPLGQEIAANILLKSSRFIPKLTEATVLRLRTGYVKIQTRGLEYSLYSPESPVHFRTEGGVEQKGFGYFSASGMKMTYTFPNALMIKGLVDEHFKIKKALSLALQKVFIFNSNKLSHFYDHLGSELGVSNEASLREYVSIKTGISLTRLRQVLPDDQLAVILREHAPLAENHAILCPHIPLASQVFEREAV